uniref:RING-type E3 ubiquitin transferase n=1 Tax=Cyprinus carpio carpio TaxID=630221 RepID=A0A9J8CUH1_CYPCA
HLSGHVQRRRDQSVWTSLLVRPAERCTHSLRKLTGNNCSVFSPLSDLAVPSPPSWPCLHQWLETRPNRQVCPVCKAGISRDKVIPLYGRGSTGQQDPRERTPPRPQGQRPEPENRGGFQGFGFGDGGFQMSFGIGAFPFGIFATAFNINDGRPPPAAPGTPQHADEQFLSRLFLFVALLIMFWLLIA